LRKWIIPIRVPTLLCDTDSCQAAISGWRASQPDTDVGGDEFDDLSENGLEDVTRLLENCDASDDCDDGSELHDFHFGYFGMTGSGMI
jgi:hypothetical protein